MLEKKEKVLLKKAAAEVEKAKEFTRAKNKRGTQQNSLMLVLENIIGIYSASPLPIITYICVIVLLLSL